MIYREFGKTGWSISAIGLGTWNIGNQWGPIDDTTAWSTIRTAVDQGVNLFDTAESYGTPNGLSEERLGTALVGIRHQVYVVSKIGNWGTRTGQGVPKATVDMIRLCAHASLHRLRSDWHDALLCHEGGIEDPSVYLDAFEALKEEGRLRVGGISTDSLEVLERFNARGTCGVVEVSYSVIKRGAEEEVLPYCQEHGIGVLVRGPLAMGVLSGRYDANSVFDDEVRSPFNEGGARRQDFLSRVEQAEVLKGIVEPGEMIAKALQYVISHPAAPVAIPGAKSPEQAAMNARAGSAMLSPAELEKLKI